MLAYKIVNWAEAPGRRHAHEVVTPEKREVSRRHAQARRRRIARALGEKDSMPIDLAIGAVIRALGFARAEQLVKEARAIHAGPGMLVRDGSRNRTVGGIFFQLAGATSLHATKAGASGSKCSEVGASGR